MEEGQTTSAATESVGAEQTAGAPVKKHKGFSSKIGFVLAAAGSAVGLGNLWRFPYLVGSYGGAAFVFVYIFCVLLCLPIPAKFIIREPDVLRGSPCAQ